MKNDDIFKAASGFGGGMGMQSDTCGALVGAGMMLSLKYGRGRDEIENLEALRESGVPVAKLYKWFQTEFGSATCHDIRTKFGGGSFYDFSVLWQRELAEKAMLRTPAQWFPESALGNVRFRKDKHHPSQTQPASI